MKIDVEPFRIHEGKKAALDKRATKVEPFYGSKADYAAALGEHVKRLSKLQEHLHRSGRYALLIVLQGMDTAGKDGAISHVMSGVNPQGCKVVSFKAPTSTEAAHDFLWRETWRLPERGEIGVFNRSYYEPVLVTRVHPELLRQEGVPDRRGRPQEAVGRAAALDPRLRAPSPRQRHALRQNLSPSVEGRTASPPAGAPRRPRQDLEGLARRRRGARHWRDYMRAYEHALTETSVDAAPWHVVPADDKPNARLIVSQLVINALEALQLTPPPVDEARRRELDEIRARLTK